MTHIKLCGLTRLSDIAAANRCRPDYVGFVLAPGSRRSVTPTAAAALRAQLDRSIAAVGVFVDADPALVIDLLTRGVIDLAQLHGHEDDAYIRALQARTGKPVIRAFRMQSPDDVDAVRRCPADWVLLDAGTGGTGTVFDWNLAKSLRRPYFLAGGLDVSNISRAVRTLHPYAVDVSSGIESDGVKDPDKMAAFVAAVRTNDRKDDRT